MRTVKRDVVFKGEPQLPAQRASYRLQSRPEQTMMHDHKIDVLFCSLGQNARRNINRRADARDRAGIFDLNAVKGIVPIAYLPNPQKAVRVTDNLGKRSHEASVAAFVSTAEAKHRRLAQVPLHDYGKNYHLPFDPADFLWREFFEYERIGCAIAHSGGDKQRSAHRLRQALYARGDVHGVSNRSELQPLRRTDAPHNRRAGMDSDSNLNRRAAFHCKFVVQLVNRAQNLAPGRHSVEGVI